jgi:hypothetical protein
LAEDPAQLDQIDATAPTYLVRGPSFGGVIK